jgi:hypothetical protein
MEQGKVPKLCALIEADAFEELKFMFTCAIPPPKFCRVIVPLVISTVSAYAAEVEIRSSSETDNILSMVGSSFGEDGKAALSLFTQHRRRQS